MDIVSQEERFDTFTDALTDDKELELTPSMKEEKYIQLYNAIFNSKKGNEYINQTIGKFKINQGIREYIFEITSLLSGLANDNRKNES